MEKLMDMPLQTIAISYIEKPNDETFNKLYFRITPGLKKYISGFFTDRFDDRTDDVLSKTFYNALTNIHQYNSQWNFSTWIYRIARNECLQELKKMNKQVYFSQYTDSDGEQLDPIMIKGVRKEDYYDYIENDAIERENAVMYMYQQAINEMQTLGKLYKDILIDREIHGMKYKDLATKYNLPENTLKSRIRLGRIKLREKLEKYKVKE